MRFSIFFWSEEKKKRKKKRRKKRNVQKIKLLLVELPSRLVCINISSELKVVPDNSVTVKRNTVAIQWLVDYLWISVCFQLL